MKSQVQLLLNIFIKEQKSLDLQSIILTLMLYGSTNDFLPHQFPLDEFLLLISQPILYTFFLSQKRKNPPLKTAPTYLHLFTILTLFWDLVFILVLLIITFHAVTFPTEHQVKTLNFSGDNIKGLMFAFPIKSKHW